MRIGNPPSWKARFIQEPVVPTDQLHIPKLCTALVGHGKSVSRHPGGGIGSLINLSATPGSKNNRFCLEHIECSIVDIESDGPSDGVVTSKQLKDHGFLQRGHADLLHMVDHW